MDSIAEAVQYSTVVSVLLLSRAVAKGECGGGCTCGERLSRVAELLVRNTPRMFCPGPRLNSCITLSLWCL
jgi:hypothetical protein